MKRRIVGVELDGKPFPLLNFTKWPVPRDGRRVGKVTSAVYSRGWSGTSATPGCRWS